MLNDIESYILGFTQTDGTIRQTGNHMVISIELSSKDEDILHKINNYLNNTCHLYKRTRDTNFKKQYTSVSLTIKDKKFISKIYEYCPSGKKSEIIEAPKNIEYSIKDYWRGIIDGDGSLGIKKSNEVYLSLVTASEQLYIDMKSFLKNQYNIDINLNRNKRDNVYNITILGSKAFIVAKDLYNNPVIGIDRKIASASKIINLDYQIFNRSKIPFTKENDKDILFSTEEAFKMLPMISKTLIKNRKKYLNNLLSSGITLH